MTEYKVQISPELTSIAQVYRNEECIADKIFPRIKIGSKLFEYTNYNKGAFYTVPETLIGDTGVPNKIDLKGEKVQGKLESHAISDDISLDNKEDYANSDDPSISPEILTQQLTDVLLLRKEIRIANILADKNIYGQNYKELSKDEKIDKDGINAVKLIQDCIDGILYKPNKMILSRKVASKLRQNPYIVEACSSVSRKVGMVSLEAIKELFDLKEILVGESVHNVSKKSKDVDLQSCWQNDIVILHVKDKIATKNSVSFGYTVYKDNITVGSYIDPDRGTKGVEVYKAFYNEKTLLTSSECGGIIKGVLS